MTETNVFSHEEAAELRELLDRQAIWRCLLRYLRGVDRMDQDLIRSAFWPDAHNTHGPVSGTVEDFIAGWHPAQAAREVSFHLASNQTVDFDDTARTSAHAETYFIASIKLTVDDEIEVVGGRYADRYEKRDGEWRIKERLVILDWQGMMDASGMAARKLKRHTGSRSSADPTYERPLQRRAAINTPW